MKGLWLISLCFTFTFSRECRNFESDKDCDEWASLGECENNFDWMRVKCRKSCGSCHAQVPDCKNEHTNDEECDNWAEWGECWNNMNWMRYHCKQSCNACLKDPTEGNPECTNKQPDDKCAGWAREGECALNPEWMRINCKQSCQKCPEEDCLNIHNDGECDRWALWNECRANPLWMSYYCPMSCDKCPPSKDTAYQKRWFKGECGDSRYDDAGEEQETGYIVGGRFARIGEYPWQAALRYSPGLTSPNHACGAIIIHPRWVVTAAHCIIQVPTSTFDIVVGDHVRTEVGIMKKSHKIDTYYVHQAYGKAQQYDSDIAVIRLQDDIEFNEYVQPACAPSPKKTYEAETTTVSGWGSDTADTWNPRETLASYTTTIPANWACDIAHWREGLVTDNMICAGKIPDWENDACQGDSGGPMVVKGPNRRFEAVGAVSWGASCASGPPGVYVRISKFLDWIDAKMQIHGDK